ncbi:hypothetical protein D5086_025589 [Populus alba]|uniref:Uncharacterized protein n=1 Tax=Populus alba TaxID=43335 RepID=A0ACC4AZK6_POPAL
MFSTGNKGSLTGLELQSRHCNRTPSISDKQVHAGIDLHHRSMSTFLSQDMVSNKPLHSCRLRDQKAFQFTQHQCESGDSEPLPFSFCLLLLTRSNVVDLQMTKGISTATVFIMYSDGI